MDNQKKLGHITAFITIFIWGTTFISTKILLVDFEPIEILFIRFVIGFIALVFTSRKFMKHTTLKQELIFMGAGLTGVCLYYLMENIALTYTSASNVGVIISISPFFIALLSQLFMKDEEKLHRNFFIGFVISLVGIALLSFQGSELEFNPLGDFLAILAALLWAIYALLTKKISGFGYSTILTIRRTFFYGIVFIIPTLFFFDFDISITKMLSPLYLIFFF